jgi:hypothetical protein
MEVKNEWNSYKCAIKIVAKCLVPRFSLEHFVKSNVFSLSPPPPSLFKVTTPTKH